MLHHGIAATFASMCSRLETGWQQLQGRFREIADELSVSLMRAVFQQVIPPTGSYACEVWGLRRVQGRLKTALARVRTRQLQLCKRLLHVPKSVGHDIVLRELDVMSPDAFWLRSACRFWNLLSLAPPGSLHRAVALSDWDDALSRTVWNWAWGVRAALLALGYHLPANRHHMAPIDVGVVMALRVAQEQQCWDACDVCPRTCASRGPALSSITGGLPCPRTHRTTPSSACPSGLRAFSASFALGWVATNTCLLSLHAMPVTAAPLARSGCATTAPRAPLGMSTTCCLSVLPPGPLARLLRTCFHLAAPCCNLSRTRTTWALRVASLPVLM